MSAFASEESMPVRSVLSSVNAVLLGRSMRVNPSRSRDGLASRFTANNPRIAHATEPRSLPALAYRLVNKCQSTPPRQRKIKAMEAETLTGSLWNLFLYDVAEEIRLDDLGRSLHLEPPKREPSFRGPAPDYVRFAKPPVVQNAPPIAVDGHTLNTSIHYYEYGVVSLAMELPF